MRKGVKVSKMMQNKRIRHQRCANAYAKAATEYQGKRIERIEQRIARIGEW